MTRSSLWFWLPMTGPQVEDFREDLGIAMLASSHLPVKHILASTESRGAVSDSIHSQGETSFETSRSIARNGDFTPNILHIRGNKPNVQTVRISIYFFHLLGKVYDFAANLTIVSCCGSGQIWNASTVVLVFLLGFRARQAGRNFFRQHHGCVGV